MIKHYIFKSFYLAQYEYCNKQQRALIDFKMLSGEKVLLISSSHVEGVKINLVYT